MSAVVEKSYCIGLLSFYQLVTATIGTGHISNYPCG